MDPNKRIEIFEEELKKTMDSNFPFVIFTSDGPNEEFVQFANVGEGIMIDLPSNQLTQEGIKKFESIAPRVNKVEYSGGFSYQVYFDKSDIKKAAEFAERIFREIFSLDENYEINDIKRG